MRKPLLHPFFLVLLATVASAQGSDDCGSATPIAGYGSFAFDTNGATTGSEGQSNPQCDFFGYTIIDGDVWFEWTAPEDSTVRLSTCGAAGDTKIAVYAGSGCPSGAPLACNDDYYSCVFLSQLEFTATAGNTYPMQIGNYPGSFGSSGDLELTPVHGGGTPPGNDDCDSATELFGTFGVYDWTTENATTDGLPNRCLSGDGQIENDVWGFIEIPQSGSLNLGVYGSSMQGMRVMVSDPQGSPPPSGCPYDVSGQCGESPDFNVFSFPVQLGEIYVIRVGTASDGTPGDFTLSFDISCNPPEITSQPESANLCEGDSHLFSVGAYGTEPLVYQWIHNESVIHGETSETLAIDSADATDEGNYIVYVTNPCGEVFSDWATLTVSSGPEIVTEPVGGDFCEGEDHTMFVDVTGSESPNFQWYHDGVELAGATSAFHALSNLSTNDAGYYTVEVTDDCGATISAPAVVEVADCSEHVYEPEWKSHPYAAPELCSACKHSDEFLDPVYLFSGEYYVEEVDLRIPGRGMDFTWARKYRSRVGPDTAQGAGWDFSYNLSLQQQGDDLVLTDGNSRSDRYETQADGSWSREGFFRRITEESNGSYKVQFPNHGFWKFNGIDGSPAEGRVTSIEDRNSNRMEFEYDSQGRLVLVRDTLNREITITYHPSGRISSVEDFVGRQVTYEYYQDGVAGGGEGDLASVTTPSVVGTPNSNDFPDGKTTVYTYSTGFADEALNHNLLTITDPTGQTWLVNEYDTSDPAALSYDHLVRQTWGDPGNVIDVVYAEVTAVVGNGQAVRKAILNDRVGNVKEIFFDEDNNLVMRRDYTGRADPDQPTMDPASPSGNPPVNPLRPGDPAFYETLTEFNNDSLATRIVHPEGNEEALTYDETNPNVRSQGNLLSRTFLPGPRGSDDQPGGRTETFEYDDGLGGGGGCCGTNFVSRHVDFSGNETLHDYDAQGNRTHTQHRIPSIVEDFEYNGFGQPTRHTLPDNDGHRRVDEFVYYGPGSGHQEGYLAQEIVDATGIVLTTVYEYDTVGNLVRRIDPRGNDTLFTFNELNQVVRTQSPAVATALLGSSVRYEITTSYDNNDNVVLVVVENLDETGAPAANPTLETSFEYETLNFLVRVEKEVDAGHTIAEEFEYDANRKQTVFRMGEATNGNQPENQIVMKYDERELPFRTARAGGSGDSSTDQFDYDGNGNQTLVKLGIESDPRVTTTTLDGYDRPVSITDPMGNVVTKHYDAVGNMTSARKEGELEDGLGSTGNVRLAEVVNELDAMDRVTKRRTQHFDPATQNPIGDGEAITETSFSDASLVLSVTNDNGHVSTNTYDTALRVSRFTDAAGNTMDSVYDANSNLVSLVEIDHSDLVGSNEIFTSSFQFDSLDRLVSLINNAGSAWSRAFDSRDNLVVEVDSLGRVVRHKYDGLNRLLATHRDLGGGQELVTSQTWDDSSRLLARTDDNGKKVSHQYDALDRPIVKGFADGSSLTVTLDVHDNVVAGLDANGTSFLATFDLLNREVSRVYIPGPSVSSATTFLQSAWDGRSSLIRAVDDDSTVAYSLDSMGHVLSETLNGHTTANTCDGMGNRTSLTYPGGRTLQTTYDALERKKVITDVTTLTATPFLVGSYDYVGAVRVSRRTLGNGTVMDLTYDGITGIPNPPGDFGERQIVGVHHHIPGGATLFDRTTTWNRMGNRTSSMTKAPGLANEGRRYAYDAVDRMVRSERGRSFDRPVAPGIVQAQRRQDQDYTFDGVGNRVSVASSPAGALPGAGDYVSNGMNEYSETPFDTRSYDANGNLNAINPGTFDQQYMVYDARNQLVLYGDLATGEVTHYAYDAIGRRIAKVRDATGSPSTTLYLYDGWKVVEERDGAAQVMATYVYGNYVDEPLTMQRARADHWYHQDDLYSVRAISDSNGVVLERYEYRDFGEVLDALTGDLLTESGIGNPYHFTGRRHDPETGWHYYRTRYLDPKVGQFTTRDTIGIWGSPRSVGNGYTYVLNNPLKWLDNHGTVERNPNAINCLGYATGEGCGIYPSANTESLKETLKKLGWNCSGKGGKSKDCECDCKEKMLMVYVYKYSVNMRGGKRQDPFNDPWIRSPRHNDYHAIRCDDKPTPGPGKYKCTGWSYVPHNMSKWKRGIGPIGPQGQMPVPLPNDFCSHCGKFPKDISDADKYWGANVPGDAYCCCKP